MSLEGGGVGRKKMCRDSCEGNFLYLFLSQEGKILFLCHFLVCFLKKEKFPICFVIPCLKKKSRCDDLYSEFAIAPHFGGTVSARAFYRDFLILPFSNFSAQIFLNFLMLGKLKALYDIV